MERANGKERKGAKGVNATLQAYARINYYFRSSWSNICANRKSRRASGPSRAARPIVFSADVLRSETSQPATAKRQETIAILFIAAVKARWEITIVVLSATAPIHDGFLVRQLATGGESHSGKWPRITSREIAYGRNLSESYWNLHVFLTIFYYTRLTYTYIHIYIYIYIYNLIKSNKLWQLLSLIFAVCRTWLRLKRFFWSILFKKTCFSWYLY